MVKLDFEKSDINNKNKEIKKLRLKNNPILLTFAGVIFYGSLSIVGV